jgi:hypothetical protein
MDDLGYSRARNVTYIVAAPLLFAFRSHTLRTVCRSHRTPTAGAVEGQTSQSGLRKIRTPRIRTVMLDEIVTRSDHDRVS